MTQPFAEELVFSTKNREPVLAGSIWDCCRSNFALPGLHECGR